MTPAERKRAQRQRDKLAGWVEVTVKVAADQAQDVRDYASTLPPPAAPTDPRQLSLIEQLDRALEGDAVPKGGGAKPDQGSLF